MVQKKNTPLDDDKADQDEAAAPAVEAVGDVPTPTQAEMDEARLNMGRAFTYETRDGKAD